MTPLYEEESGALPREQNVPVECDAAAGADARAPGRGRPRPQRAGVGGNAGKFRQTSSVIAAAGEDARAPGLCALPGTAGATPKIRQFNGALSGFTCYPPISSCSSAGASW